MPLVSIVIPAFKPDYFKSALESVAVQDFNDIEIYVSDDSADDNIFQIVQAIKKHTEKTIHYIKNEPSLGEIKNHEKCLGLGESKYIKFMHDDDIIHPTLVSKQVALLHGNDIIPFATTHRYEIDKYNKLISPERKPFLKFIREDGFLDGRSLLSFFCSKQLNIIGEPPALLINREHIKNLRGDAFSLFGDTFIKGWGDMSLSANLIHHSQSGIGYVAETLYFHRYLYEKDYSCPGEALPSEVFRDQLKNMGYNLDQKFVAFQSASSGEQENIDIFSFF